MFKNGTHNGVESDINGIYSELAPVAARYGFRMSRDSVTVGRRPTVVFLGNHSSGKSTFINTLLGGEAVQDTGVAPTDDCFTVIVYGEKEGDFSGQSVLGRIDPEFASLSAFGPEFLQRLRVKVRTRDCLKKMNLIDSPGMIDSAGTDSGRGYNFAGVVRRFAEISDLVLFMFDPEKPGTTGETVSVFSKCLFGIEFKLRVLLSKCDTFDSTYDFARAYGTLCWNLSKVLHTKDMPKIYNVYTPVDGARAASKVDLTWFDKHRAEIISQLDRVEEAKYDSVVSAAASDFAALGVVVRMENLYSGILMLRWIAGMCFTAAAAAAAVLGTGAYLAARAGVNMFGTGVSGFSWKLFFVWTSAAVAGIAAALAGFFIVRYGNRIWRRRAAKSADKYFAREYACELASSSGADGVRQYWYGVRDTVAGVVASGGIPFFSRVSSGSISRINNRVIPEIISGRKKR